MAQKIPKQDNGTDRGLYNICYLHYIVTYEPLQFNEVQNFICFNLFFLFFLIALFLQLKLTDKKVDVLFFYSISL
jgi:hypothetical protein